MPVEAELTVVVRDPAALRTELAKLADAEICSYADTYYDRPDSGLATSGYKVRVRTVTTGESARVLLTYKEPAIDGVSGAKPEHETEIGNAAVLRTLFRGLGLVELIAFEKYCENYEFSAHGRVFLATMATLPDLPDEIFLELETLATVEDTPAALAAVREVLAELGVPEEDLSTESYLKRISRARAC